MPVSHIGLTVSHLPTSCSFFLAALQPLGYRYIGQQGNQVGFGIGNEADFFLCQETPGIKAGAAHIAFAAPDRVAVRDFYTAALTAGARPHGSPATRDSENGVFNAAVLDIDGNSIEVVYRESVDPLEDARSVTGNSRVLTWRKSVSGSLRDDESVLSGSSVRTATRTVVPYQAPKSASSVAPSVKAESVARSVAPSVARTQSAPVVPKASKEELNPELMADAGARKIIGTLIGAAAGAAVAYAMVKSERDSAKEEKAAIAASQAASQKAPSAKAPSQKAPSIAPSQAQQCQQSEYAYTPSQVQQMIQYASAAVPSHRNFSETESFYSTPNQVKAIEAAPARSTHAPTLVSALQSGATTIKQHRNFSETESMYSSVDSRDRYARALENAPQTAKSYLNPTCVSVAQTSASKNDNVEYIPASSVGPRSTYSTSRSKSGSVISDMPKSSRAPSQAPSKSPSKSASKAPSLISSFHPDGDDAKSHTSERRSSAPSASGQSSASRSKLEVVDERRSSAGSVRSHQSSKSKAKSLLSNFTPEDREDYPPTPPAASERRSSAGSVASKAKSSASKQEGGSGSKAPSLLGSVLGRGSKAADSGDEPSGPFDDLETVAPSDSISNAGSSRSSLRRGGSSRANDGDDDARSSHSRHSKHSKHSSSSKHSSKSRRSSKDEDGSSKDDDKKSHVSSRSHKSSSSRRSESKKDDVVHPDNISEPSDASTVKPYKKDRKDSVVSLPSRKLEGSIVDHGPKRSVVSFAG